MAKPETIVVWVMVLIIVIFIIIAVVLHIFTPVPITNPASYYIQKYNNIGLWGGNVRSDDPVRSVCHLYQFEGALANVDFGSGPELTAIPASPSLDPDILNQLTPQDLQSCYDLDQLAAAQVMHTCVTTTDVTNSQFIFTDAEGNTGVSFCVGADGTRVPIGTSEVYYTQTSTIFDPTTQTPSTLSCQNTTCPGTLSLMAFWYQPNNGTTPIYNNALCLSSDVNGTDFLGVPCDLGQQEQLVRITRAGAPTPGTSNQQTTNGRLGVLASLYFRLSGKYIVPNDLRTGLALSTDNTKVWALVPQLNGTTRIGVQQIVYIGDLTPSQQSQFNNTLSADDLLNLILTLQLKSIQIQNLFTKRLILDVYSTYATGGSPSPANLQATFMYVNYNLFNQILLTTQSTAF